MNEPTDVIQEGSLLTRFLVHELPLLDVTVTQTNGTVHHEVAFNDAWVERTSPQAAWLQVSVDEKVQIERLVADGVLVSTPAGSTAYAMAMGATPVPLDANLLVLAGSNVASPQGWKPVYLPLSSTVEFVCLDEQKRPITAVVDGKPYKRVRSMCVRMSSLSRVQLLFHEQRTLAEKLAEVQFPRI